MTADPDTGTATDRPLEGATEHRPTAGRTSPTRRRLRTLARRVRRSRLASAGLLVLGLFIVVAALAPEIAPYEAGTMNIQDRLQPPSADYPFGTDNYGRDIFSRVVLGSRIAMKVAFAVPLASAAVGVPIGLLSGYFGGWIDNTLMRLMDAIFAFPAVLLGLTIVAVFGSGLTNIIAALGVVFIPQFARVTRSAAVSVAREDHVKAARSLGASHARIIGRHVFPFCISAILVQATITAALAIIVEASLSFLGVGVPPPQPSWGVMLRTGKGFLDSAWWYSVFPGVGIILSVLGFNLLGDGLRDVFDPRTDFEQ